ncbi:bifunctional ornithine acetyltransferase/N-acetylglutamate synthase [Endozoicomonas sp. (ex Bugula neritina AB1)]|nr:bifunctional ornithine acetyltransferase/N-acetylglutamate synthase [Endozoicomonas sp. (ex Bugula neritina AB1)]
MAVGIGEWPEVKPVAGFRLGVTKSGIKKNNRRDLVVMACEEGSSVAGVFTKNKFCAAPVHICKERLVNQPCYFLVNTGNANAGTGEQGMSAARHTTKVLATRVSISESRVLPFSTGVIGEQLPVGVLCAGIPDALADLSEDNWHSAAEGIMTTDTRPKGACRQFEIEGHTYTVSGISKGAGMIKPDMATMLAFIATDAAVESLFLQETLSKITNKSFNRISIDGDTSTNDCSILVATGAQNNTPIDGSGGELERQLVNAIREVSVELAQAIVRDGEGATKYVTVRVEQALCSEDALEVAYTIAHSPLVKTALFASDPNWGRILAAVGRAKVSDLVIDKVSVWLGDVAIVINGEPAPAYTEAAGQNVMSQDEIVIRISLGTGDAVEEIWTTDLSHEYVKVNAEYRT